jgi:hypothetical protein
MVIMFRPFDFSAPNMIMVIMFRPFDFIAPNTIMVMMFRPFDFIAPNTWIMWLSNMLILSGTWWKLCQQRVVRTKLDIYGFYDCWGISFRWSIPLTFAR